MIILTGGVGFIGSCFLWKLNQEGEKNIIVVDHLGASFKWRNLIGKDFLDYFEKDVFLDQLYHGGSFNKVNAIFHIGACSSTTEQDASYLLKNNYEYTKLLAQWALDKNVPFYYASSAATYGDGSLGFSDEDEIAPKLTPMNMYGYSKQLFDLWILKNKLADRVVGIKYFNVYGPNEYHKGDMRSVVVKAYEQIKKEGKVRLFKSYRPDYSDGEQKRDFIYVKEVVEVMWQLYKRKSIKGIFNLGTGKARTWNDLAYAIFAAMKIKPRIEYIEMPETIRDKYQYFTQAEMGKLKRAGLDYSFMPLEKAVADYVGYLKGGKYL